MKLKAFKKELDVLHNLVSNLDEIGGLSAIDQAIIKRKLENLYEFVISDFYTASSLSSNLQADQGVSYEREEINVSKDTSVPSPEKSGTSDVKQESEGEKNKIKNTGEENSILFFDRRESEATETEQAENELDHSSTSKPEQSNHDSHRPRREASATEEEQDIAEIAHNSISTEHHNGNGNTIKIEKEKHNGISEDNAQESAYDEETEDIDTHQYQEKSKGEIKDYSSDSIDIDNPELEDLFTIKQGKDLSDRLSATPVNDILKAMGLNERIFTQNELFGGNNAKFTETIEQLNDFSTFAEAKAYLISTIAQDEKWAAPGRKEIAKNFIQLVNRRYKKEL